MGDQLQERDDRPSTDSSSGDVTPTDDGRDVDDDDVQERDGSPILLLWPTVDEDEFSANLPFLEANKN
jgi:hypothetical protein